MSKNKLQMQKKQPVTNFNGVTRMLDRMGDPEVHSLLYIQQQALVNMMEELHRILDPMNFALARVDISRRALLTAARFVTASGWTAELKGLRDEFNTDVSAALDALAVARKEYEKQFSAGSEPFDMIKQLLHAAASDLNDAVRAAVSEDDGGAALVTLAKEANPALQDTFNMYATDMIARETRHKRETVYIGLECNRLEAEGIKSIAKQWQIIHEDLRARRFHLTGDAKAAWEYFKYHKPYDMTPQEQRGFEKRISQMKREMKPHYS